MTESKTTSWTGQCDQCTARFSTQWELDNHKRHHADNPELGPLVGESETTKSDEFLKEDFKHLADIIRAEQSGYLLQAIFSNNINTILAALDKAS